MNIQNIIKSTLYYEDQKTLKLFAELSTIKKRGYLTQKEFLKIAKLKSARPLNRHKRNSAKFIKEVTELSFALKNDALKLHILTSLEGVRYPTASAILMFYDKNKFPIIDIRAWKVLYKLKIVHNNPQGTNFTLEHCITYYKIIRSLSQKHKCSAREIEKRLYDYSIKTQKKPIYNL